ncbi:TMhelix containing protein [Vibrio phage 1.101.O._10N.261.45.C6]|nr:TMhelix containing protein [Vibrio phage 1.101.O._10N.261.45.C6]
MKGLFTENIEDVSVSCRVAKIVLVTILSLLFYFIMYSNYVIEQEVVKTVECKQVAMISMIGGNTDKLIDNQVKVLIPQTNAWTFFVSEPALRMALESCE